VSSEGKVPARVTDFSGGGLSLSSPVFFPSSVFVAVSMEPPGGKGKRLDFVIRVQRVAMADRKPSYYVGGAFGSMNPEQQAAVASVLASLRASGAAPVPEKSRA
jgi:hypothetical protein